MVSSLSFINEAAGLLELGGSCYPKIIVNLFDLTGIISKFDPVFKDKISENSSNYN